jgi:diguanylate cyclase
MRLPASFIGRAEETGLIVPIGEAVIGEVARTCARWATLGAEQRLAINVSRRQVDDPRFFRRLHRAIREAGAPARLLELEIGETLAMQCGPEALAAIQALRADGARIAVDQFGTGYSTLMRLKELPVDRYKLDRSVTERIAADAGARAIAQALVGLVHGLGCEAVGEGIESEAQAAMLRVIGCDVIQGYAVAPPMDEATFLAWAAAPKRALAG